MVPQICNCAFGLWHPLQHTMPYNSMLYSLPVKSRYDENKNMQLCTFAVTLFTTDKWHIQLFHNTWQWTHLVWHLMFNTFTTPDNGLVWHLMFNTCTTHNNKHKLCLPLAQHPVKKKFTNSKNITTVRCYVHHFHNSLQQACGNFTTFTTAYNGHVVGSPLSQQLTTGMW